MLLTIVVKLDLPWRRLPIDHKSCEQSSPCALASLPQSEDILGYSGLTTVTVLAIGVLNTG